MKSVRPKYVNFFTFANNMEIDQQFPYYFYIITCTKLVAFVMFPKRQKDKATDQTDDDYHPYQQK